MPPGRVRSGDLHGQYAMRKTTPGCQKQPGVVFAGLCVKGKLCLFWAKQREYL